MMWRTPAERLALLELLVLGTLKKRRVQAASWNSLAELPWVTRTGRRDQLRLVEARRTELVALLGRVWPDWSDGLARLTERGLPPTPKGWITLDDALRAEGLPALPGRLNRRTAAALVAPHSKASLTDRRVAALGDSEPTHDGSVRLRPPVRFIGKSKAGTVDLAAVSAVLGEASIPERALRDGLAFEGNVRAALLVENLGAFCDLPSIDGWLFVHVAGWDTATVGRLLERLPDVPLLHFGDLDPNGVRIFHHLRTMRRNLRWFVPAFWAGLIDVNGLPGSWPEDLDLREAPALVRTLASRGVWLEQEALAFDPRTPLALEAAIVDALQ